MSWSAPATATVGQNVLASFWNSEVRDRFLYLQPISYTEKASDTSVTSTVEATPTTIIGPSPSFTYDGSTTIEVIFTTPALVNVLNAGVMTALLIEDSASIGRFARSVNAGVAAAAETRPVRLRRRHTPSAGPHTYSIAGFVSAGTAIVRGGAGGSGTFFPTTLEIRRVLV